MADIILHHAYIDEAGNAAPSRQSSFFVMSALCIDNPRIIQRIVRKVHRRLDSSEGKGELKAKKTRGKLVMELLEDLAVRDVEIFAVVTDHRLHGWMHSDPEELYRIVAARLVRKLCAYYPRIEITLDKRYTNRHQRDLLEVAIRDGLADLSQKMVLIRQDDSQHVRELQAADFVAWALYQKYERGNDSFYQLIASRIVEEEVFMGGVP